ncbi:MAG: hypothetical protein AAB288_03300 [Acidobacteriota bacterium]
MRSTVLITVIITILLSTIPVAGCKIAPAGSVPDGSPSSTLSNAEVVSANAANQTESTPTPSDGQPKTIRDFFMALPEKYFVLEGCEREKDEGCRKAKVDYLKTFVEVEDSANGYLKAGCDGAQSCLEMTIFKKPDGTYLVAVSTEAEMMIEQYFLDLSGGQWSDVSAKVVPGFTRKNFYELPRRGTTVKVFAKRIVETGDDYEIGEKGAKLYDLVWKDGKFSRTK